MQLILILQRKSVKEFQQEKVHVFSMSIETNMLVLDQFRYQMPILCFGQHLDCLNQIENP